MQFFCYFMLECGHYFLNLAFNSDAPDEEKGGFLDLFFVHILLDDMGTIHPELLPPVVKFSCFFSYKYFVFMGVVLRMEGF